MIENGEDEDFSIPLDISKWSLNKIKNLVVKHTFDENETLEYLQDPYIKENRKDYERKICSFANTSGGVIIFGVKEVRTKDKKQLLKSLELGGIEEKPNWDIRIGDIYKRAIPPIRTKREKFSLGNDKVIIVLVVQKNLERPVRAGDGQFYIRIQSQSTKMNYDTIKNLFFESDVYVQRRKTLLFEIDYLIEGFDKVCKETMGMRRGLKYHYFDATDLKSALVLNPDIYGNKELMQKFYWVFEGVRQTQSWEQDARALTTLFKKGEKLNIIDLENIEIDQSDQLQRKAGELKAILEIIKKELEES